MMLLFNPFPKSFFLRKTNITTARAQLLSELKQKIIFYLSCSDDFSRKNLFIVKTGKGWKYLCIVSAVSNSYAGD